MKKLLLLTGILFIFNATAQTISWSQNTPGGGYGEHSIATDSQGNVYSIGTYNGAVTDFDPGSGVFNMSAFSQNMFVLKTDAAGNFVWAKQIGGSTTYANTTGTAITIDSSDNLYLSGGVQLFFGSIDMDPGAGVNNLTGNFNYIEKLDSSGNFAWVKTFGTASILNLKTDKDNNIYATGSFTGTADFDPSAGVSNLVSSSQDPFVLKLDNTGSYIWAKALLGGQGIGYGLDIDVIGNVYTVGYYSSTIDLDPGTGVHSVTVFKSDNPTQSGINSLYLSKLDKDGNYVWGYGMNGDHNGQWIPAIAVDKNANVIISSYLQYPEVIDLDFGTGTFYLPNTAGAFLLKIDTDGKFVWAKSMATPTVNIRAQSWGNGVTLDSAGNIYSIGSIYADDYDMDPSAASKIFKPVSVDSYITKLDNGGNFIWSQQITGSGIDEAYSLAIAPSGKVYVRGNTSAGAFARSTAVAAGGFLASVTQPAGSLATTNNEIAKINLYPNPTVSSLNLNLTNSIEKGTIKIISMLGQTIFEKQNLSGTNFNIDVSGLNRGNYILQLEDKGLITTAKFIKQ